MKTATPTMQARQLSSPDELILAWTGASVSCWQSTTTDFTAHAAPSSPLSNWALCGEAVSTPLGWASDSDTGRAVIIPFMLAVQNPPQHIDGGYWHICPDCLEEYLEK